MSCILSLTAAAVIAGVTISSSAITSVISDIVADNYDVEKGVETMFVDSQMLLKTLHEEYDCEINVISENEYEVQTNSGNLVYKRENANEAFKLYFNRIDNVDALMANLKAFEVDYGRNVQAYTYGHLKQTLADNMEIVEEEVLEDDSLYLTINVQ